MAADEAARQWAKGRFTAARLWRDRRNSYICLQKYRPRKAHSAGDCSTHLGRVL